MSESERSVVRRVVTGHDDQGRAVITQDGAAPHTYRDPNRPGHFNAPIWQTMATPAALDNEVDPTRPNMPLTPPDGGSVFRIVSFPPDRAIPKLDLETAKAVFSGLGAGNASTGGAAPHPLMHRTRTLDYGLVLSGEIVLILDTQETTLKAGDVVVQRGTNHAWSNRSDEPCVVAFVMLDGSCDPAVARSVKSST